MTSGIKAIEAPTRKERMTVGLVPMLALSAFVTMLHAMAISPLIPAISADLGTSVSLLGQVVAVSTLLAAGLGLIAGPLIDRFGHRRALVLSLLTVTVSALGMGLAPSVLLLLAAALVGSFGRAVVQPVALVIAGSLFTDDRQRRAVSWVMAGMTGAVVAGVPALAFATGLFGWRVALVGLAACAGTVVPMVAYATRGPRPAASRKPGESTWGGILNAYRPLLAHRPTLALLASVLVGNGAVSMMAIYLGAFLSARHGYTSAQIGWAYFAAGITLFAGNVIAGGRVGGLPPRPVIAVSRIVIGAVVLAIYVLPISSLATLAMLGVQGMAMGVVNIPQVMLLLRESPGGQATTMTLSSAVVNLSTAFGGLLGGAVIAVAGFEMIGMLALGLSTAAALLIWLGRWPAATRPPHLEDTHGASTALPI